MGHSQATPLRRAAERYPSVYIRSPPRPPSPRPPPAVRGHYRSASSPDFGTRPNVTLRSFSPPTVPFAFVRPPYRTSSSWDPSTLAE